MTRRRRDDDNDDAARSLTYLIRIFCEILGRSFQVPTVGGTVGSRRKMPREKSSTCRKQKKSGLGKKEGDYGDLPPRRDVLFLWEDK